jgi:hypothetical protein
LELRPVLVGLHADGQHAVQFELADPILSGWTDLRPQTLDYAQRPRKHRGFRAAVWCRATEDLQSTAKIPGIIIARRRLDTFPALQRPEQA